MTTTPTPAESRDIVERANAVYAAHNDDATALVEMQKVFTDEITSLRSQLEAGECEHRAMLARALAAERALADEREACAKIVEGRLYKERYREWPEWGTGNRSLDSELVRLTARLAAAIRARAQLRATDEPAVARHECRPATGEAPIIANSQGDAST